MSATLAEHFAYIGDERRQERFRTAISRMVRPGDKVADLGCGFGILGMLCLEAGAGHVWGIDSTEAVDIARESMSRQGLEDRYTCLRDATFRAELPEKVDLLVCDHVGYFGVDYGIVAMLEDARRRFLKPGGRVMPQSLELRIAGVASQRVRERLRPWDGDGVHAAFRWLSTYSVNAKHDIRLCADDLATKSVALATIDLAGDSPAVLPFTASLDILRDGALDGLGGWFLCELAPGVTMTNAPGDGESINRSQVLLGFETPLAVAAGDRVEVTMKIRHEDEILSWTVCNPRTGQRERQSTFAGLPVGAWKRRFSMHGPLRLSREGEARTVLLSLVDGVRTGEVIEREMLRLHPTLFPSEDELVRFVRAELARSTL